MIVVIIAGGSGTRLWPLSTPDYPKHLLRLTNDSLSLVEATYERAKRIADHVYVVSEKGHGNEVRAQLSELSDEAFIIEPARRGTANCMLAALAYLAERYDPNEPIAFLAADHYIRDVQGFSLTFTVAAREASRRRKIVLVGVEPTYPATGFGYIEKGKLIGNEYLTFTVQTFKEKPNFATAQRYVKSGNYLWNCGYFVGTIATFEKEMQRYAANLYKSYQTLRTVKPAKLEKTYLDLVSDSMDYALIEKVPELLVVTAAFDWVDLGSFHDLHNIVEQDDNGNHVRGAVHLEEVENSFVRNEEYKPLVVIGLDNVVVVNTPRGIIVVRKDLSQKIGDVAKMIKE